MKTYTRERIGAFSFNTTRPFNQFAIFVSVPNAEKNYMTYRKDENIDFDVVALNKKPPFMPWEEQSLPKDMPLKGSVSLTPIADSIYSKLLGINNKENQQIVCQSLYRDTLATASMCCADDIIENGESVFYEEWAGFFGLSESLFDKTGLNEAKLPDWTLRILDVLGEIPTCFKLVGEVERQLKHFRENPDNRKYRKPKESINDRLINALKLDASKSW